MSSRNYKQEHQAELFTEMTNFMDVNTAYSDFITNAALLENDEILAAFENISASGPKSFIQSRREIGLNVFYNIFITRPRGSEFQISVPWKVSEVCSHCQGQGQVYAWNGDNSAYESVQCDECGGEGERSHDSEISLFINDALCEQPIIRKRKAGRFNPRLGQRGDLVINISWVDELPPCGETVN